MPSPKSILFVLGSLGVGGVEKVTCHLVNYLYENGWNVNIVVLTNVDQTLKPLISPNIGLYILPFNNIRYSVFGLSKVIRSLSPQFIFSAIDYINVLTSFACFISLFKGKLILSERGHVGENYKHAVGLRQKFFFFLVPIFYLRANLIHFNSEGVKDSFFEFHSKVHVPYRIIHNPISVTYLERGMVLERSENFTGVVKILSVSRLVKQKNLQMLIRGVAMLHGLISFAVRIVGDGPEREQLQSLAVDLGVCDHIEFTGFCTNVVQHYEWADIFVLTSDWEGFGNVLVEALSAGCKIVSTDCFSGPSEILGGGIWGELVEVGDVNGLADAIIRCLHNTYPDGRKRAGEFSVENIGKQYEIMFSSVR